MKLSTETICNIILLIVAIIGISLMHVPESKADGIIQHTGFPQDSIVQSYVQYARDISNGDMDFITTLEAENGLWNPQRQSEVWSNGVREDSRGFCQLHRAWHSPIVDDPRFKSDPYRQLEECYKKYVGGTTFYGYFVRGGLERRFSFNGTYSPKHEVTIAQSIPSTKNTYFEAKKAQEKLDKIAKEYANSETQARKLWKACKDSGECIE